MDAIGPHFLAYTYDRILPHNDDSNLIVVGSWLAVAVALALALALALAVSSRGKAAVEMTIGIVGISGLN